MLRKKQIDDIIHRQFLHNPNKIYLKKEAEEMLQGYSRDQIERIYRRYIYLYISYQLHK